ncbi:hypothetical protein Sya03_29010 [Spirilliplanes yamanashiensis]|uniref:Uncharacterized protein n=1 Tax=Spirilliplanes yamanashiensis TaxID=42233 RepID=A0A8J3Y908_9ACTN|nr:hypothetical protein Sya03_29010 [Spirilliplanes yamanashiensis]
MTTDAADLSARSFVVPESSIGGPVPGWLGPPLAGPSGCLPPEPFSGLRDADHAGIRLNRYAADRRPVVASSGTG